jgi:hypothetical protein
MTSSENMYYLKLACNRAATELQQSCNRARMTSSENMYYLKLFATRFPTLFNTELLATRVGLSYRSVRHLCASQCKAYVRHALCCSSVAAVAC